MDVHFLPALILLLSISCSPSVAMSWPASSSLEITTSRCHCRLSVEEVPSTLPNTTTFVMASSTARRGDQNGTDASSASTGRATMRIVCGLPPRGGHSAEHARDRDRGTKKRKKFQRMKRARYKLLDAARHLIGCTATKLWRPLQRRQVRDGDDVFDHSFDELDRILDGGASTTATTPGNDEEIAQQQQQQQDVVDNKGVDDENAATGLGIWPPLPQAASFLKGWKERSLRAWINQMEIKFISTETAKALRTIRNIIDASPDYGVVDLIGMYRPKDVIWSIVALSRLQHMLDSGHDGRAKIGDCQKNEYGRQEGNIRIDDQLAEEVAHYCSFANVAYGWKGSAFCGRWHLFGGNNRMLVRATGIDKRDIIMTSWKSRVTRPAYYIVRERSRKAVVLGIRGSLSPSDILTDLCASSENFIVEDEPSGAASSGDDDVGTVPQPPPLIVGRAHKGMVDAARSVARATGKTISDELAAHPDFALVIVGHSLGGGVAAVLTAMWTRRFRDRVRSIGYGSPCVFPLNATAECGSRIVSVVGRGDPFATISLGHLADVTKALSTLSHDSGLREGVLTRTGGLGSRTPPEDVTREDYRWCANAMAFLRTQMDSQKLYPPGKIYLMSGPLLVSPPDRHIGRSSEGDTTVLTPVEAQFFNELKLHARMLDVSLHIPLRYETVLRRLVPSEIG